MARPAPIRLVGMMAATATFAALATEASAQQTPTCDPQAGETCSSTQTQTGDVTGQVDLNVSVDQLTVSTSAQGNALSGGVTGTSASLVSRQSMTGATVAPSTVIVNGEADGQLSVDTTARGNYLGVTTDRATFAVDASQSATGDRVEAGTYVQAPNGRVLQGGFATSTAVANAVALGGPSSSLTGVIDQRAQTTVFAETVADVQYIPAPATFSSQAVANAVQTNTTGASHQDLAIRQSNAASTTEARTDVYVDNGWDLTVGANAGANQAITANAGGSMLIQTDQANAGRVRADARVQTNLQGQTVLAARSVANETVAGNNDIYLKLDNTQLNTGGVEANATYVGVNGYDAYVGSDAVGNAVTGYACSQCGGDVNVNNNQTNSGNVTATTNATVSSGRTAVIGANAVGNSASFYISRPGG
ncbi:holdfast anchor protein HfaD [Brevundimonas vesicularis]|uniref:Holdfast anchor protein HfaD n=2 Tax=Brevundimonas vesicularis TaxID=41276 RepID=A0ABU4KMY9_BREVE|nr:holdfast anchor protein HfaD [Brevundimonas vesicularis]MDX2334377.1 holdfast anchor protein HfaD [Brevundimonas vesicularis]